MDASSSVTTKLLTLLNVSATKIRKRKTIEDDFVPSVKLNKRKSITFAETHIEKEPEDVMDVAQDNVEASAEEIAEEAEGTTGGTPKLSKCNSERVI